MDDLLSYCGLVDARISTSEKDLPVTEMKTNIQTKPLSKKYVLF